ncbi:hypothetical protein CRENBAI_018370 [Crenichthys baileyi]|uniref:Uncharacterized protein n=1 Tax=Crenichthys baileyi TaxID=28760 RepID=A0AAV9RBB7_9TELE
MQTRKKKTAKETEEDQGEKRRRQYRQQHINRDIQTLAQHILHFRRTEMADDF